MIIMVGLLTYCMWTLFQMLKLIPEMIYAWVEYNDGNEYFRWSYQYSYFDTLSAVRGTWESPHERFMRGKK